MKKIGIALAFMFAGCILFLSQAEADTAVTIAMEAGPALTEENLETVDLIVPERPAEALPLQVGDKVFFETLQPLLEGEGTILFIYDTEDPEIKEAIIIDHALYE